MQPSLAQRVLRRYAGRMMSDEKFRALLLKIRKGAISSLTLKQWIEVLERLGGWSIDKTLALNSWLDKSQSYRDLASAEANFAELQKELVSSLPTHPSEGRDYIMNIQGPTPLPAGRYELRYDSWRASKAVQFRSPEGAVFNIFAYQFDLASKNYNFDSWAIKHTKVKEQAAAFLGMPTHEQERAEKQQPRTRAGTGTCPCCFSNIKLKLRGTQMPVMHLHGYKRPGTGSIYGNCWCVGFPPFELSPLGVKHTEMMLEGILMRDSQRLDELKSGGVTELPLAPMSNKIVSVGDPRWPTVLAAKISEVQSAIKDNTKAITRAKHLISTWQPRPLPEEGGVLNSSFRIF